MFKFIGGAVVYSLALIGLFKVLAGVRDNHSGQAGSD